MWACGQRKAHAGEEPACVQYRRVFILSVEPRGFPFPFFPFLSSLTARWQNLYWEMEEHIRGDIGWPHNMNVECVTYFEEHKELLQFINTEGRFRDNSSDLKQTYN